MNAVKRLLGRCLRIEGLATTDEHDRVVGIALALAALAVILRFFFWWYTGRIWEDALITVLHSENFVRGLGMTHYCVGQPPLHGFTSPLSVLVPLIGDLMKLGFGLSFIKLVSAFAGGLAVIYVMAIAIHPRVKFPAPLAVMAMGYVAFEHHQILFGMAGMETQLVTLVLLMAVYYTIAAKPVALGISLGLCMLGRPDFAFWTIIVGVYLLIRDRKALVRVVPVALAVYLPWVVFTTLYYGSPIPNTMVAKGLGYDLWTAAPHLSMADVAKNVTQRVTGSYAANGVFQPLGPGFCGHGGPFRAVIPDHGLICNLMLVLALMGALAIVRARQWPLLPLVLFVGFYGAYYVFLVAVVCSWYVVPLAAAAVLLSARGLQALGSLVKTARRRQTFFAVCASAYLVCIAGVLPKTFATERRIQQDVEDVVRKQVGLFLAQVMGPDETVGCEPLGYVSYFSQRTVYDWPGLANRQVVEFLRTHRDRHGLFDMLEYFKPDYLVLRYSEYNNSFKRTWIDAEYTIIASFEISTARTRDILLIGKNSDIGFFVLAKRDKLAGLVARSGNPPGIDPLHVRAYAALGLRAGLQGRFEEALGDFGKAVQIEPDYAEAHYNLAMILMQQGQYAPAAAKLREVIRIDPADAQSYALLGACLAAQGRIEEAMKQYRAALDLDPTNEEIQEQFQRITAASSGGP